MPVTAREALHLLVDDGLHDEKAGLSGNSLDGVVSTGQDLCDGEGELNGGFVDAEDLALRLPGPLSGGTTGPLPVLLTHVGGSFLESLCLTTSSYPSRLHFFIVSPEIGTTSKTEN